MGASEADSMKTVLRILFFYEEVKEDATKVANFIERFYHIQVLEVT